MIEVVKMDYVNTAMERMERNEVRYRFVMDVAASNLDVQNRPIPLRPSISFGVHLMDLIKLLLLAKHICSKILSEFHYF